MDDDFENVTCEHVYVGPKCNMTTNIQSYQWC